VTEFTIQMNVDSVNFVHVKLCLIANQSILLYAIHEYFIPCSWTVMGLYEPNVKLKYNYALIVVDSCSRYPFSYPLSSLHAKNVCDTLIKMFQITNVHAGMTMFSYNGSNFPSALTQEFMKRLVYRVVWPTIRYQPSKDKYKLLKIPLRN